MAKKSKKSAAQRGRGKKAAKGAAAKAARGSAAGGYNKRLYVVGDKETGVLFVTLKPMLVSYVPKAEIQRFAAKNGVSEAEIFRDIASKIKLLILKSQAAPPAVPMNIAEATADAIYGGTTISDAEFCFIADLVDGKWEANRIPFPPLFDALDYLAQRPGGPPPQGCPDTQGTAHEAWLVKPGNERKCAM